MNGEGRTSESSAAPPTNGAESGFTAPDFRWQALFQRSLEPVFVLNRGRRILFVNRAWQELTGVAAAEARGLACVRRAPMPQDPWDVVIRSLCCPPPEVLKGQAGRSRRLLPGASVASRWWDIDFLPLKDERGLLCIVGRITVLPQGELPAVAPLPEKLMALREGRQQRYSLSQLASKVPAFQRIGEQVRLASQTRVPVLIVGERGTGKQTIARTIHHQGAPGGAFMALDCARLPAKMLSVVLLVENSLQRSIGSGTRYLMEPQSLPRDLQAQLCDTLRAGSEPETPRTIAGISTDPTEEIKSGRLLEGLHYALGTIVIALPGLRERLADLPALVDQFLDRANHEQARPIKGLTAEAWDLVRGYAWPGNLRELFAALQSASLRTSHDRIDREHFPAPLRLAVRMAETAGAEEERKLSLERLLQEAERRLIRLALRRAKGNRSRAAELLEVWRPRLLRRMEALGISNW